MTPNKRGHSKVKPRIKLPISRTRKLIQDVEAGSLDLPRARLIRMVCNQQIRLAKLTLRAERSGMDDPFFNMRADRDELKEFERVAKQLSRAISS